MDGIENNEVFKGFAYQNPISSYMIDKVSIGVICLYLIDAIIKKDKTPYLGSLILKSNDFSSNLPNVNSEEIKLEVIKIYTNSVILYISKTN